ncbi:hypothetical protein [Stenotrophomonas sp. PS02289]|uniref:hypothetical protein n=1 Tax=Stenotrophomonas sp. PS02289 TaxID=2991422 RepID=UPI00249A9396|nr:hypothetical protein [Stenotrophomonas sp. PS02289]
MSKLPLVPVLALLLAACGAPTGETSTVAGPAATAPAPTPSPTPQEEKGMHKECNGARLSLTVLPATDETSRTRMDFEKDGQRRTLENPPEMSDYSAVGLACVKDAQGASYFVVQFGEVEQGCAFCEWFYLYDTDGKPLTHSNPPLKGEGDQQSPNNDEYSALLTKLGITHPQEVDYIEE